MKKYYINLTEQERSQNPQDDAQFLLGSIHRTQERTERVYENQLHLL